MVKAEHRMLTECLGIERRSAARRSGLNMSFPRFTIRVGLDDEIAASVERAAGAGPLRLGVASREDIDGEILRGLAHGQARDARRGGGV